MGLGSVMLRHLLEVRRKAARLKIVSIREDGARNRFTIVVVNKGAASDLQRAAIKVTRRGRRYEVPLKLVSKTNGADGGYLFPANGRVSLAVEMQTTRYEGGGTYEVRIWPIAGKVAKYGFFSRRPAGAIPLGWARVPRV